MITRFVKIQLIVFAIIGALAIVFVGARYAQIDRLMGWTVYTVKLEMSDGGGIFEGAQVAYRGIGVGRVGTMRMTEDGVSVDLELSTWDQQVPASAKAYIASRSAVGEQFVDLRPDSDGPPWLKEGDVITEYTHPPALVDMMRAGIEFADSVPLDDLNELITELGYAFDGQSENLTRLVDSLEILAQHGADDIDELEELLASSNVALGTQAEQSDEILTWSRSLEVLTAALASSDPDIRRILTSGPVAATQISALVQQEGPDIGKLVGSLAGTVNTIAPADYTPSYLFALLSALSAGSHSAAPGDGQIHFGLVLETNNPVPCTRGYESTQELIAQMKRENPNFDINYDEFPMNENARCTVPAGNPTGVRGGARADLADPSIVQPWDNIPKKDPDKLNLNPLAQQLAFLLGVHPR